MPATERLPDVTKLPALTLLVTVNDLAIFKLPAKEEEPVPLPTMLPVLITRPVPVIWAARRPLVMSKLPAKELEAVPEEMS